MKTVELSGVVIRIIDVGTNYCRFIFNDLETGDLIIGVDRTYKLFYEIQNGMALNLEAALKSLISKTNFVQNSLSVVAYEIQNVTEKS